MKEDLKQVSNLVECFQQNIEAYRNPAYNETQLRIEFLKKMPPQRGIDAKYRQIGRLVYELLGLTEDEIKIVEEQTK